MAAWAAACRLGRAESADLRRLRRRVEVVHRDWRRRLRRGQAGVQADYNQLVAGASLVRHFETAWFPGLVQTAAYARHVFREQVALHALEVHDEDEAVAVRLARRRHLYDPAKRFEFLLAEPVLRWRVCPADVLRGQLAELQLIRELPNVRFGVLPLDRALATTPLNGFQLYDGVAVTETFTGEIVFRSRAAAVYTKIMERLWRDAALGLEAHRLIAAAMAAVS